MTKKVKKWGKVKLFETSAVGIPMYDYAINKSFKYSLIKALTETEIGDELNKSEEIPMEEDAEVQTDAPESEVSEPEAEAPTEEAVKPAEEVEKGLSKAELIEVMTKGFEAAIKSAQVQRGLVEEEDEEDEVEKARAVLKGKSLGELAIMNGMFKAPDMYGRIK